MTAGYLLDTNQIGHAVSAVSAVRRRIMQMRASGARLGTCVPALCEIEAGIQKVKDPVSYRANMARLLNQVRIWPMDQDTARVHGALYSELRQRGKVLSQVDMMLAALARQMDLTLVTSDRDFVAVEDIKIENWIPAAR